MSERGAHPIWHDIGTKTGTPGRVWPGNDSDSLHGFVLTESELDLSTFDAVPADLHLVVAAADELESSVGELAPEVTSPIHALGSAVGCRAQTERGSGQIIAI
jgi:hypothetical protein